MSLIGKIRRIITRLLAPLRRLRAWLHIAYGSLDRDRQAEHKHMIDAVSVFYGFTFVFIFTEAIRNVFKLELAGQRFLFTSLTVPSAIFLAGVVMAIALHAVALARLQVKLTRARLHRSIFDIIRFGYREQGKIWAIIFSHFLSFLFPFLYIELNRENFDIPYTCHPALMQVDLTVNYWNYAAIDVFLLVGAAAAAVFIKKVYRPAN